MPEAVPPRLAWAVERLEVEPDDRLLEIGCGVGIAVSLVCERLRSGRIWAIDRSPTAVERAVGRNEEHVVQGKAVIQLGELADLRAPDRSFTKVFAIDVNLFWTRSPEPELEIIRRLLLPEGALYLFYAPPSDAKASAIAEQLQRTLPGAKAETETAGETPLVAVIARV